MFESLLLASVLLITVSQFLPKEKTEKNEKRGEQRANNKSPKSYHLHQREQPCRDTLNRAVTNRAAANLLYNFK